jgi:hypothetical protein
VPFTKVVTGPAAEPPIKDDGSDTLEKIADTAKLGDWRILARYNWGTAEKEEVNRALFEYVGWNDKHNDPEKTALVPHPDARKKIKVPKLWEGGSRAVDKMHVVTLRPEPKPPVAIRIDKLDKWFIPKREKCHLKYTVQGLKQHAGKLGMEVYGSNYCELDSYDPDTDLPSFKAPGAAQPLYKPKAPRTDFAERGSEYWPDWRGEVNVAAGVLKKRSDKAPDRYINVAFSPYTVLLRLYNTDADADARLLLQSFWPQFKPDGKFDGTKDESKIRWSLSTSRFEANGAGTLEIWDRHDHPVYRKPLSANELKKGDITVVWKDGKYGPGKTNSNGGDTAIPDDMPYRVQVQIHTGPDEDNGLALAAMHTEVRLYVHPDTKPLDADPYIPKDDANSAILVCSESLLATRELKRKDGLPWVKLMLAKAGFHPGPIDDKDGNRDYDIALKEFQRSVPKKRAKDSGPYERFGGIDPAADFSGEGKAIRPVKDTLEELPASDWKREWFGKADDRSDLSLESVKDTITDPTAELVAWVDDRHAYTTSSYLKGALLNEFHNSPACMGNYAGEMGQGDGVAGMHRDVIPRPCLPFAAGFPLMSRRHSLFKIITALPEEHVVPEAVGPLRVDWTFDEIDGKPPAQDSVDTAAYAPDAPFPPVQRTKAQLQKLVGRYQADYNRKDKIRAVYANCPTEYGGIRPEPAAATTLANRPAARTAALSDYYKAAFAMDDDKRLRPYPVIDDAANERIATVVHDDLGQPEDSFSQEHVGRAGVYFRPSRIAGDGYKLRAQLRLEQVGAYDFPNLATLKARYAKLPQAWSAGMRLWRKASIRGFVGWMDNHHWNANRAAIFKQFEPGCVHFVCERDDANVEVRPDEVFPTEKEYRELIRKCLDKTQQADKVRWDEIGLEYKRLWPWFSHDHYGYPEYSTAADFSEARKDLYKFDNLADRFTTLLGWRFAEHLDKGKGKLRGLILCEFELRVPWWMRRYVCTKDASHSYVFVERAENARSQANTRCRSVSCSGKLQPAAFSVAAQCSAGHQHWYPRPTATGPDPGKCSECARVPSVLLSNVEEYACNKCRWKGKLYENGTGGNWDDQACTQPGCSGKLYHTGAWKQDYECDKCGAQKPDQAERDNLGGSHTGSVHCGYLTRTLGRLRPKGAVKAPGHTLVPGGEIVLSEKGVSKGGDSLGIASVGLPLGAVLTGEDSANTWAHEFGHNRFMQHAGNAPGSQKKQHDSVLDTGIDWAALPEPETVAKNKNWDRSCLMSYIDLEASYDAHRDKIYMCAKCALKQRGWKVEKMGALEAATMPRRGETGDAYSLSLKAAAGVSPYVWSCAPADGAAGTVALPHNGLDLAGHKISGTPAAAGTMKVKVIVTDALGDTSEQIIEIEVLDPLAFAAPAPSKGTKGTAYPDLVLTATGGKTPYKWSCAAADTTAGTVALPNNGLDLDTANHKIAGTPVAAGTIKFKVVVEDALGNTAERVIEIETLEPLAITAVAPPKGRKGAAYPALVLAATGGKPAYTWSCAAADATAGTVALPHNGLDLDAANHKVSGTPAAAGTVKFKVVVTDSLGTKAEQVITIDVDP